jgi:hypothetical protein
LETTACKLPIWFIKTVFQIDVYLFSLVPVPLTAKETLNKEIYNVTRELHKNLQAMDIPYVESLEHYFNNSKNVEHLVNPIALLAQGGVGFSDWSRFMNNYDLGWGKHTCIRSFVETSPLPAITILPYMPNTIEVVIQLDAKSDREFITYAKTVH